MADIGKSYPLVFRFREPVEGKGFLAGVDICGRVLAVHEADGSWWLYGVKPGAIAEGAESAEAALVRFVNALRLYLWSAAADAPAFAAFEGEVRRFFNQDDDVEVARWDAALAAIRSGKLVPEPPFDALERRTDEVPCTLEVARLDDAGFAAVTAAESRPVIQRAA